MVTRKAIVAAFEAIIADRTMKSITVFCVRKDLAPLKTSRVRVTRKTKSPDDYIVTLGRMNYEEREFVKRQKKMPRTMIRWKAKAR